MLRIRVLTAAVLSLALLAALFVLPPRWTVLVLGGAFSLGAWEWSRFGGLARPGQRLAYAAAVAALLALGWAASADRAVFVVLLGAACAWWVLAFLWLSLAPERQHRWFALLCGVPVLVPSFVALARLQVEGHGFAPGPELVLWLVLLVVGADIGAYFAGRQFGRLKLAPRVSPSKTWEGAIGGMAAVALVACAASWRLHLPLPACVAFGCAVGVFSIIGDLTESMFKRAAGLKDSGGLLPGHGGVLDRIDSVTAAAPLYALGLYGSGVLA